MTKSVKKIRSSHQKVTPNCIYSLNDDDLGFLAKAALVRLVHLDNDLGEIFYSNGRLAKDLNVSLRAIVNALKELEVKGYIIRNSSHASGTKITEIQHKFIIARLFEKPSSNRHLAWLRGYYKTPRKIKGRFA